MFEIPEFVEARLASVTNRIEKHGDEDVPAITLKVELTAANTILDGIEPSLRHALYKAVEGQDQLPGVEPATPVLRSNVLEKVLLTTSHEGWRLAVDDSIDENEPMLFGGVKVDKLSIDAKQGGSIVLGMRLGTSDIDAERLGALGMHNGQSIWIKLLKPEKAADVIDGTTAAFEADHPDATDLFAAGADLDEVADGESADLEDMLDAALDAADPDDDPQDDDAEGSHPDAGSEQPADPERGTNWSFGTNTGADGTNEAGGDGDAAAFEAGAAKAVAAAKGSRRGRKVAA